MNRVAGANQPEVRWSAEFLNTLARSSVLRYLAVAHFGRGRGKYVEGEAPSFWRTEVEQQFDHQAEAFRTLWGGALQPAAADQLTPDLRSAIAETTVGVLHRLYPATVPAELIAADP